MSGGPLSIVAETNRLFSALFQVQESCDFHLSGRQRVFEMLKARRQLREEQKAEGRGLLRLLCSEGPSPSRPRQRRGLWAQECVPRLWDLTPLIAVSGAGTRLVDIEPLLLFSFLSFFLNLLAFFFSFSVCSVQNQTVLLTAPWGL